MSNVIAWISAAAEHPEIVLREESQWQGKDKEKSRENCREKHGELSVRDLQAHQFPSTSLPRAQNTGYGRAAEEMADFHDREQERRTYRGRTVAMLRRYMRYSIETGRLPSQLGREFFRTRVTSYSVVTFEDRVIFVHDMESCLDRLDEFSRQLIARHILQEHDQEATARLLHCNQRTVRRLVPLALDQLSEILLEMGLLERLEVNTENSCQGGEEKQTSASDWEDSGNKTQKMSG
jgi:DNA-directed RNA polymerase specialized sigma24 family protein